MKFYERVISDFGGYEKCKDILSQPNIDFIMNTQGLREHMLEYRREHNIFEVGDKVVFINQNMSSSVKIIKEILNDTHVSFNFHGFHIELIRHAIDEEIKAGKRLEVANENISNHN